MEGAFVPPPCSSLGLVEAKPEAALLPGQRLIITRRRPQAGNNAYKSRGLSREPPHEAGQAPVAAPVALLTGWRTRELTPGHSALKSGCASSSIAGGRSCMLTVRHCWMMFLTNPFIPPQATSGSRPDNKILATPGPSALKGRLERSIKNRQRPQAQMSTRSFHKRPKRNSGALYKCVPRSVSMMLLLALVPIRLALLKSAMRSSRAEFSRSRFAGFKSRWTMRFRCRKWTPSRSCKNRALLLASLNTPSSCTRTSKQPSLQSSMQSHISRPFS
mmetsp:Transcript_33196/g.91825  ORF Transcript_33196/g.91825 Transcript_33196/m.91825 type:complete len:274 (-) Transcript_33196:500-1321(-)